ncbi:HlyD family efflux transporter periplasmic adaptor subunit [Longimicrobium terrae]|uniref:Multidrug resistance efflux pump n=1 Tax=Longimicrobium terrae TaxID=1639882 RepID=A0A841GVV1_9BACT|nr:multidrug resistance efflux pump [Longimicrobium terrae]MBB6069065.1 multidrug resistance efflux pump [Longimicrobium terrae]NNC28240.1 HlyD family efflux transporter periplasmic adaptor subunit [Longimicrobium terrae]
MDIPRAPRTTPRRYVIGGAVAMVLAVATVALARMEPAAPKLDGASVWTDTVKRGTMMREVRGPGTLVPEQIRWVSAVTAGRVERILVQPGMTVQPGTPLLVLSNADVQRDALEAQRQLVGAEADKTTLGATLENQRLTQEAAVATVRADQREAERQAVANRELAGRGLISRMELQRSEDRAEELSSRLRVEEQRLRFLSQSMRDQLSAQQTQVERLRGLSDFQRGYVESMRVLAGTDGVVRELPLQEGQWVTPGSPLAVVVRPGRLKAQLRIPETQARDLVVGQTARIDTRNGIAQGRVSRIDPAVQDGSVTVDVTLEGELPRGARPDLSVDGVIEIERIPNVLYVDRPAYGQAGGTLGMFRVEEGGRTAARTDVRLGRSSVNTVEVLSGLREGDVVILSDMTAWDRSKKVRLR